MAEEVMKKLEEHDTQLEIIARTVVNAQKQLSGVETRVVSVENRLTGVENRLVRVETKLDRVEQRMENFVTKEDHQEVMNALDALIVLAQKKDQELTFVGHQVKRNTEDIAKIKPPVGLEALS